MHSWLGHNEKALEKLFGWRQQEWHGIFVQGLWDECLSSKKSIRDYQVSQRPDSGKSSICCVSECVCVRNRMKGRVRAVRGWAHAALVHLHTGMAVSTHSLMRTPFPNSWRTTFHSRKCVQAIVRQSVEGGGKGGGALSLMKAYCTTDRQHLN